MTLTPKDKTDIYCEAFLSAYGLRLSDVREQQRTAYVSQARRELVYHLVEEAGWTPAHVGRVIERDPSTILNACAREQLIRTGEVRNFLRKKNRSVLHRNRWNASSAVVDCLRPA